MRTEIHITKNKRGLCGQGVSPNRPFDFFWKLEDFKAGKNPLNHPREFLCSTCERRAALPQADRVCVIRRFKGGRVADKSFCNQQARGAYAKTTVVELELANCDTCKRRVKDQRLRRRDVLAIAWRS